MTVRLVLASASPRRADVLRQLGLDFEVRVADVDESPLDGEAPGAYVRRLAKEKAEAVHSSGDDVVVAGDTVVIHDGRILGKPTGPVGAERMLAELAGGRHQVLSSLAVARAGRVEVDASTAEVDFRAASDSEIARYVATGEPLDKAGGYGIQGLGAAFVASISGDYYTVVGFPVALFQSVLGRVGLRYDFGTLVPVESADR